MKIKISADSTCDLSKELIEKHDIGITPLSINMADRSLRDGIEITPADIFDYVRSGAGVCSTTAVNYAVYHKCFSEWLRDYDAVIHINISSDMSACHQNATIVARELKNVFTVDSRNLSTGTGHLVLDAAELAMHGVEPEKIKSELERRAENIESSFLIDTLEYLYKGGRCNALQALGANLLSLKPCIGVLDGKMDVGKKYRGDIHKCIPKYVRERLSGRSDIDYRRIFITHTGVRDETVDEVRRVISECGPFEEIIPTTAGCAISSHCGPNTLGVLFYRKPL